LGHKERKKEKTPMVAPNQSPLKGKESWEKGKKKKEGGRLLKVTPGSPAENKSRVDSGTRREKKSNKKQTVKKQRRGGGFLGKSL